jgi:tetratricopeptide (TPR) repeat protein
LASDKRKILEAARKYAQRGAKDRALKEYEKLLKLDPRDAKLRLEVGDALRRWGQVDEAAAAYRRVAEQYTAEGFDARAVAVYKQIQQLDPRGYAACEPLAELYQRMGLASEAITALQAAADGHARDGNKRHALELLRRMAGLDPTNTATRIKVADLLRQEKLLDEAAAEYEAACAELERQGELEGAGRVIERLLELRPDRVEVLCRLARNLLSRGKADQAEAPARRAAEREPQEIAHQELLAQVYGAQKRDDRLAPVYRRIAELHRLRGDEGRAREILQRFVPMGAFDGPTRETADAADPSPFGSDALELDEPGLGRELLQEDDPPHEGPGPPAPRRAVGTAPAGPLRAAPSGRRAAPEPRDVAEETVFELGEEEGSRILGEPEQLLAEASVYLRYGKRAQAIENLQAILARQPHHRGALEKLGDAYADDGDAPGAVAAWLRAAELARDEGDLEAMGVLRDRVAALDAAAAATLEPEDAAGGEDDDEGDEGEEEYLDLEADPRARRAGQGAAPEERGEAGPPAGPARAAGTTDPGEPAEPPTPDEIEIDLDGVAFDERLGEDPAEATEVGAAARAQARSPAAAARSRGATGAADTARELEIDLYTDRDAGASASADGAAASRSGSERIAAELEEAEFYLQQGLATEARAIFERVLATAPGHPLALLRLGEIAAAAGEDPDATGAPKSQEGPREAAAAGSSGAPPRFGVARPGPGEAEPERADAGLGADGDPGTFDLAAELSAALDEGPGEAARAGGLADEGLRAVLGAFKRGVRGALGSGDHEAHYDLGIAYREMGLLDDAIAEFRSAMTSPARRIGCLHMLGLCALEQDRAEEAVDYLSHALASPDLAQEQELAIRFELGRAYERCGEVEKARAAWEKVASVDPTFCEVGELLATLERRAAAPSGGFESFGDLLAEVEAGPEAAGGAGHESFDDLLEEVGADLREEPFDAERRSEGADDRDAGARRPAARRESEAPPPRRRKISFV